MCVALAAAADLVRTRLIRNVATGGEGHEVLLASQPTVPTELSHGLPARRFPPPWSVATAALSSAANGSFTTRNDAESASLSGLAGWRFWPSKAVAAPQWRRRPGLRTRRHTGQWNSCLPVDFLARTSGTKNTPPRLKRSYRREGQSHE